MLFVSVVREFGLRGFDQRLIFRHKQHQDSYEMGVSIKGKVNEVYSR